MNAVIVDDEQVALNYFREKIAQYEDIVITKAFTDSVEAMVYLLKHPCDVLFLDIEMPTINGIYLAEQVIDMYPDTRICFVTAYNEYAVRAFELNAVDYILKPYVKERFEKTLEKLRQHETSRPELIAKISEEAKYELEIVCAFDEEDIVLLPYTDIYYFEVVDRTVLIHIKDKVYRGNKNLNFYENKLCGKSFYRTHKSYIVNLEKVMKIKARINYTYDVLFRDIKDIVPLSRSKIKDLKQIFNV